MLLYLTRNEISDLLDFTIDTYGLVPKKMIGSFSLMQFVIRDMRNFSHCKYFVIDRKAVTEKDDELIQAINSFKTMYSSRIIIINEDLGEYDSLIQKLVNAGVTDIVTADTIDEIKAQILECLSDNGMERYKVKQKTPVVADNIEKSGEKQFEKYRFNCKNIKIAVAGSQRRTGVTTTAINFANWLSARGATVCYIEANNHSHLQWLINLYNMEQKGNAYTLFDVDYYITKELEKDYNFIIYDCGEIKEALQEDFSEADVRVLCGCAMPYEAKEYIKTLKLCGSLEVNILGMFVPDDLRELCQTHISPNILYADSSHELFNDSANSHIYKKLISKYLLEAEKIV